ncbi:MAG: glycosyltransferase family 4 protein [Coriobacteriia bacterium]
MRTLRDHTIIFVTGKTGHTLGRIERRWLRVMEALVADGATVLVICALHAPIEDPARAVGATIAPIRLDKLNLIRTRSRMRKYIKRYRPPVAHSTGYEADVLLRWAAKDLPVKVVTSALCATWPPKGLGAIDTWFRRRLDRRSLSRIDAFLVDCEDLAERVVAAGVARDRVVLDPPSVAIARMAEESRAAVTLPVGSPVVGYAGALERNRGLPMLASLSLKLRECFPDARVVVAGEGPARAGIVAAGRDGRLDLLGGVTSVPAVLAALDVCVYPVTEAGTPTSLLEAAALGRPIVASAVSGIADLFEDGVDLVLVPPNDSAALATAVIGLLEDPQRARSLGEHARHTVIDKYSSAAAVKRHLDLYRRLSASV